MLVREHAYYNNSENLNFPLTVRCDWALLQSNVVVDLLVVQVLEGGQVTESKLQDERPSQSKMYMSDLFKILDWCTTWQDLKFRRMVVLLCKL